MVDTNFIFTGDHCDQNWFFNRWYCAGANNRYFTWQVALSILNQRINAPLVLETGCQRLENDIGAGESTTIFCEYIKRYGGKLISVDINHANISGVMQWTKKYDIAKEFHCMDSLEFLKKYDGPDIDLVYLDSFDYPIEDPQGPLKDASQRHNLEELKLIWNKLKPTSVVLLDDNQLPGGGKPLLAKKFLLHKGWTCLLDFQQSLWIKM